MRALARPVRSTGTGSPVFLARVGDTKVAYVADADDGVVLVVDAERLSEVSAFDVGGAPEQLLLTGRGRLFATLRDRNTLVAIEGTGLPDDPMHVVDQVHTAVEPIGLAAPPNESVVLVTSGWGHLLAGYDAAALREVFSLPLGREPRGVVTSDDGRLVFVSHAVGSDIDVIDLGPGRAAKRVSLDSTDFISRGELPGFELAAHAGQGFAIARALVPAGRIFAPHTRIRTAVVDKASGYGSGDEGPTETFNVGVLDEDTGAPLPGSIGTNGGLGCVLPRAVVATDGGDLLVSCLGTSEVVAMDSTAANPHGAIGQRLRVPAGPMGIVVDDTSPRALVWSQFDHALTWLLVRGVDSLVVATEKLPRRVELPAAVGRGRVLFHSSDERISSDGRACASCHPDGRDDGQVWSTPDGPRNAPMLAGRLDESEPYGWLGGARDLEAHLGTTLARLGAKTGKKGLSDDDKRALVSYVLSMKPPTVPQAEAKDLRVTWGKRIYESPEAGCAGCHGNGGLSPDGQRHNVLSWADGDVIGVFDTPSLRFVGGTGPYFHDGRFASLRDLLTRTRGAMGQSKRLSDAELDALEAYVRTL